MGSNKPLKLGPTQACKPWNETISAILSALGVLAMLVTILVYWPSLPDRIPIHFNDYWRPDGFGSKWNLFLFPVLSLIVLFAISNKVFSSFAKKYDQRDFAKIWAVVNWLKVESVWLFWGITWGLCLLATGVTSKVNEWVLPAYVGIVFLTIGFYFVKALNERKQ